MMNAHDWMLEHIVSHCEHISFSAARIANTPGKLDHQETFRTTMEAELGRAERELMNALQTVRDKINEYKKLPRKVA